MSTRTKAVNDMFQAYYTTPPADRAALYVTRTEKYPEEVVARAAVRCAETQDKPPTLGKFLATCAQVKSEQAGVSVRPGRREHAKALEILLELESEGLVPRGFATPAMAIVLYRQYGSARAAGAPAFGHWVAKLEALPASPTVIDDDIQALIGVFRERRDEWAHDREENRRGEFFWSKGPPLAVPLPDPEERAMPGDWF